MELAQKARRLIITTTHTTRAGTPKILEHCDLPLTAKGCVNTIITELAVMDVVEDGLLLREIAEDTDLETVVAKTGVRVILPQGDLPKF
jgi:3-oxoacid CoA-transferase subunit B